MLVKAKWNVKDAGGWHSAGEVFETNESLGNSVEVLEPAKPKRQTPEKAPEKVPEHANVQTAVPENKAETVKQKTPTRRKGNK